MLVLIIISIKEWRLPAGLQATPTVFRVLVHRSSLSGCWIWQSAAHSNYFHLNKETHRMIDFLSEQCAGIVFRDILFSVFSLSSFFWELELCGFCVEILKHQQSHGCKHFKAVSSIWFYVIFSHTMRLPLIDSSLYWYSQKIIYFSCLQLITSVSSELLVTQKMWFECKHFCF